MTSEATCSLWLAPPDPTTTTECDAVTPQMRSVLAKLDPYPACVQGGKYDLLAYNTALRLLLTDLDDVPETSATACG